MKGVLYIQITEWHVFQKLEGLLTQISYYQRTYQDAQLIFLQVCEADFCDMPQSEVSEITQNNIRVAIVLWHSYFLRQ